MLGKQLMATLDAMHPLLKLVGILEGIATKYNILTCRKEPDLSILWTTRVLILGIESRLGKTLHVLTVCIHACNPAIPNQSIAMTIYVIVLTSNQSSHVPLVGKKCAEMRSPMPVVWLVL